MRLPNPVQLSAGATRWNALELVDIECQQGLDLPEPPKPMLNVREVANRYGVSVPTIWRWAAQSRSEEVK